MHNGDILGNLSFDFEAQPAIIEYGARDDGTYMTGH
jgi:hypothetical protein